MDVSGLPAGWKWGTDYAKVTTCVICGDECVIGEMIKVIHHRSGQTDYYCSKLCLKLGWP